MHFILVSEIEMGKTNENTYTNLIRQSFVTIQNKFPSIHIIITSEKYGKIIFNTAKYIP